MKELAAILVCLIAGAAGGIFGSIVLLKYGDPILIRRPIDCREEFMPAADWDRPHFNRRARPAPPLDTLH